MRISVVNKYKHTPNANDVYIGRGSPLGNPYPITKTDSRDAVCDRYEEWLDAHIAKRTPAVINELNRIYQIMQQGEVNLVCFCKPQRCHGDYIKAVIISKIK